MKRGVSPIIATVFLVLITVVAAGIIVAFVVPFVRNNLSNSGNCFNVVRDLSFDETPYNCYDTIPGATAQSTSASDYRTGFSVRIEDANIVGFRVSLQNQGDSVSRDIKEAEMHEDIRMLSQPLYGQSLLVPGEGEVRTYVHNSLADKIEIFPILSTGEVCDLADQITIQECTDAEATTLIITP